MTNLRTALERGTRMSATSFVNKVTDELFEQTLIAKPFSLLRTERYDEPSLAITAAKYFSRVGLISYMISPSELRKIRAMISKRPSIYELTAMDNVLKVGKLTKSYKYDGKSMKFRLPKFTPDEPVRIETLPTNRSVRLTAITSNSEPSIKNEFEAKYLEITEEAKYFNVIGLYNNSLLAAQKSIAKYYLKAGYINEVMYDKVIELAENENVAFQCNKEAWEETIAENTKELIDALTDENVMKENMGLKPEYKFTEEMLDKDNNSIVCKIYCPGNNRCSDLYACCFCEHERDMVFETIEGVDPRDIH